ncbi:SpaA isopeptide-forming pilin-related protein [Bifidobacterium erythrocebi]|nr:SpaA isopeptide-forming pilin-related protein [Bifidobacterium sp. DSM 109960]
MNYLSTVKQQSRTKVLGDFKFKKTSKTNPDIFLKGAKYVVKTTDGKYLTGTQQKDGTYLVATDAKTGELITTTDRDKALQPVTDSKGGFTVRGVPGSKDGVEYKLTEIETPSGYARSTGDVTVKVRVAKDLKTKVDGGEGTSATVTKSSIKADASSSKQWQHAQNRVYLADDVNPNPEHDDIDYAASGDALAQEAEDGSAANEVKNASDYDGGADLFIKNGGNKVTFSTVATDDSALPAGYQLEHQTSTLTDGTGKELLKSSDKNALAKVSDHVNTIIGESDMKKTTDYYDVNTEAVYHDTTSADNLNNYVVSEDGNGDQNVQRDVVLPVSVKLNATKKLLKNGEKEPVKAGEFKFNMKPDAESAAAGAPQLANPTVEVGSDGLATWDALDFTADWWDSVKKDHGTADFTYDMTEVDTGSKKYDYDSSTYKIRFKVSELDEHSEGVTNGLTLRVYVNGKLKLTTTSDDQQQEARQKKNIPTVEVRSDKDPESTFINTEKVTDFSFTKKNGETGDALEGAVFQLYRHDGDCDAACKADVLDPLNPKQWVKIDTQTSDSDGKVTFADLASDTYRLIESKAPDGYTRPSGQWNVVVDLSQKDKDQQITITEVEGGNKPPAFKHEEDGGLSVANYKAKTIPSTGGRGLIAFSLMGAVLVLGGAFVLSKRVLGEDPLNV